MCWFRGARPLQNIASFVEVAVAPISGHTSSPHRMRVANDEKNEKVLEKCHQHINTQCQNHKSKLACRHVVLRIVPCATSVAHGRGKLEAGRENAARQKPAQDTFPNTNSAIRELKIINAPDANLSFKEVFMEIKSKCTCHDKAVYCNRRCNGNDWCAVVTAESTRNATIRTSEPSECNMEMDPSLT